ncbi:MAG: hypothetical protein Q8920_02585 [Bacillota bacterium]|nr:hypothetical protein [Bacillota bacterium]
MTMINCSSDCIHQKEGVCTLENTAANVVSALSDCIFFQGRNQDSVTNDENKHD